MMLSITNAAILAFCMAFFAWRSYKKGVWKAFLGLLGFVGAYLTGFLVAPHLGHLVSSGGAGGIVKFMVAMMIIFVVTSALISSVPPLVFPALRNVTLSHKLWGACLGAVTGVIFAILIIWFVGVAGAMLLPENKKPKSPDALSELSSKVVSKAISSGIAALEEDQYRASATSAFLSAPAKFTKSFQSLSQSDKLDRFWQDGRAQFYMSQGDIDQLMREPAFLQLVEDPSMQQILDDAKPKGASAHEATEYFAQQVSFVWRRMRTLRSDQRVAKILNDPEVKALVHKKNPMAMLTNDKIQSLIEIVMEQPLEENMAAAAETLEEFDSLDSVGETLESVESLKDGMDKQAIYKWLDEKGDIQYSDLESTPEYLRDSAERIK